MTAGKTDEELLRQWRAGDSHAGRQLFERHFESVARFFANKISQSSDDLVQETFLGCLEGLDRFRGTASFRTLLFAIAKNKLYSRYAQHRRERERFDPRRLSSHDLGAAPTPTKASGPEKKLLLQALRRLPLETQAMLELHYWERLKLAEIAEIFDCSLSTIKNRMFKGRNDLKCSIAELERNPSLVRSTIEDLDGWARKLAHDFKPVAASSVKTR